jgi:hypothetical protein
MFKQLLSSLTKLKTGYEAKPNINNPNMIIGRAEALIEHHSSDGTLLTSEKVFNLITDIGRRQYHRQCFGTSGLATNGMNYIALSNDTVSETAASTSLSNEITTNGLGRAQGTVTLPSGSGTQTTISKVFTATGTQSAQKMALFDAASTGNMNHVLAFTQRNLITDDTLTITVTITLT